MEKSNKSVVYRYDSNEPETETFTRDKEIQDILFAKLKELAGKKFTNEENYLDGCHMMMNIAYFLYDKL